MLSEPEFWYMFDSVHGDVQAAIKSNYAYLTIHNIGAGDRTIYDQYQRHAQFWTLSTYALQTTFFMAFGRVFDHRKDSFSIQKLLSATVNHPELFSKTALRERKRNASRLTGPDPQWLVEYVDQAWEPTKADLQPLTAALAPHHDKFKEIYRPIRHRYFAHRGMQSQQAILALFSKTLIGDVAEILRFLHTLLWAIREMAWNARRPNLSNHADFTKYVDGLNKEIEAFIRGKTT